MLFDDVDRFHEAATAGDHVLDHGEAFAGTDGEAAAKDKGASVVLFAENVGLAQLAGDFLSDQDAAEGGRDHGVERGAVEASGEGAADAFGHLGIAQEEGALEKLAAVQAGAEDEVAVEEGAGLAEKFEDVVLVNGKAGC